MMTGPKSRLVGLTTSFGGRLVTTIYAVRVMVSVPTGPVAVKLTVLVLGTA